MRLVLYLSISAGGNGMRLWRFAELLCIADQLRRAAAGLRGNSDVEYQLALF
ncbi:MAG: hypothetical protein PVH82_16130 [Desulfobacteraceae bacterium]